MHYTPMWKVCLPPAVCLNIPRECITCTVLQVENDCIEELVLYINSLYQTVVSNVFVYVINNIICKELDIAGIIFIKYYECKYMYSTVLEYNK